MVMPYTKVRPVIPFAEFIQRASSAKAFTGSTGVHYDVARLDGDSLWIRRRNAADHERVQRLHLGQLYRALDQLENFSTEAMKNFVPGLQSPGRGLLLHLGLIQSGDKIIFFNTGWMTSYRGLIGDRLQGGGKHVEKHGWGSEIFNFLPFRGKLYGYVQPKIDRKYNNAPSIAIEKLGASSEDDSADGITVVWTANDPVNGGTRIVGWYKNARVFRYHQLPPDLSNRRFNEQLQGYYAVAKEQECTLLPIDARKVKVLRQRRNWMGQSNVWYADKNPEFVQLVTNYIFLGLQPVVSPPGTKGKGTPRQRDLLKRLKVEQKAIECVCDYYTNQGYVVDSVEKDNVGWDLTATDHETMLKLEVKGLSGLDISTELTPNEYDKSTEFRDVYRLCVVTNALHKPHLQIFSYSIEINAWSDSSGLVLQFEPRTSARIFTI